MGYDKIRADEYLGVLASKHLPGSLDDDKSKSDYFDLAKPFPRLLFHLLQILELSTRYSFPAAESANDGICATLRITGTPIVSEEAKLASTMGHLWKGLPKQKMIPTLGVVYCQRQTGLVLEVLPLELQQGSLSPSVSNDILRAHFATSVKTIPQ